LIYLVRRASLALSVALIGDGNQFQSFTISFILTLSLGLSLHLKPFEHDVENWLEAISLSCLLVTFSALRDANENNVVFQWFAAAVNAIVLCLLVLFWLWPVWKPVLLAIRAKCCHKRINDGYQVVNQIHDGE
jgi:hypothetical protein